MKQSIKVLFALITAVLIGALLSACGASLQQSPLPQALPFSYVDSTQYFSDRQSSISLRAAFHRNQASTLADGYKFQFRTISTQPVFLSSISIIAGGKRFFLEEQQVMLPRQKGVTLQLPLEQSLFVASFPSALVQFRHNKDSYIFAIELHQLREFIP